MDPAELIARLGRREFDNVAFRDMQRLAEALGYRLERVRGSHHMYRHPEVPIPMNVQPVRGQAKPYQLRELLRRSEQYHLRLEHEP